MGLCWRCNGHESVRVSKMNPLGDKVQKSATATITTGQSPILFDRYSVFPSENECVSIWVCGCGCVCVRSTSQRASQQQSVWSATEPRVRATTQAAECPRAHTTRPLPRMLPGTLTTQKHTQSTVWTAQYAQVQTHCTVTLQKQPKECS